MSEAEVLAFPRSFPKMMFGRLTDSRDVWGPLFTAWKNGVGGYKVFAEEKAYTIAGKKRIQYRIVATTSENGGAQVEVTVDATALRPVAVRSSGKLKDGQTYKMLWTGGWKVGGTLDPKTFHLPKELPMGQRA